MPGGGRGQIAIPARGEGRFGEHRRVAMRGVGRRGQLLRGGEEAEQDSNCQLPSGPCGRGLISILAVRNEFIEVHLLKRSPMPSGYPCSNWCISAAILNRETCAGPIG